MTRFQSILAVQHSYSWKYFVGLYIWYLWDCISTRLAALRSPFSVLSVLRSITVQYGINY